MPLLRRWPARRNRSARHPAHLRNGLRPSFACASALRVRSRA